MLKHQWRMRRSVSVLAMLKTILTRQPQAILVCIESSVPAEDPPIYSLMSRQCARCCLGRIVHSDHHYHPIMVEQCYKGLSC